MQREEIDRRVQAMLVEHLAVSPADIRPEVLLVPDHSGAPNLGADSLDIVELVMAAEEEFGLRIDDDDVADKLNGASVAGLVDFIAGELAAA